MRAPARTTVDSDPSSVFSSCPSDRAWGGAVEPPHPSGCVSAGTTPFGGVTEPLTLGPRQVVTGGAAERAGDGPVRAVTGVLGQPPPDLFVTGPEHVERVRHGGPATVGVGPPVRALGLGHVHEQAVVGGAVELARARCGAPVARHGRLRVAPA